MNDKRLFPKPKFAKHKRVKRSFYATANTYDVTTGRFRSFVAPIEAPNRIAAEIVAKRWAKRMRYKLEGVYPYKGEVKRKNGLQELKHVHNYYL